MGALFSTGGDESVDGLTSVPARCCQRRYVSTPLADGRKWTSCVDALLLMLKTQPVNGNVEHWDEGVNAVVAVSWKLARGLPSAAARFARAGAVVSFV